MSKFDLRDISHRLTSSRDTEAVVFEFLGYLQTVRTDWRASLAFYEVSRDALVNVYTRQGARLSRKDLVIPVDQLPPRLVRKFFHPSAFFNATDRRTLLEHLYQSSPFYEPDPTEGPALQPLGATTGWLSCMCMPLAERDELLAVLTLTSEKKGAFGSRAAGEIIPLKSMASLALAQHLSRGAANPAAGEDKATRAVAAEFQDRIRRLNVETAELTEENRAKTAKLETLATELERLDRSSTAYRQELERVKGRLGSLEEQSAEATRQVETANAQLAGAHVQVSEMLRTVSFLKEVFQVLAQDHDREEFPRTLVAWFCECFGLDRCSLMRIDEEDETMTISAQRGIAPEVAGGVRVRIGHGIAGWVAHHRKPLFVRMKEDPGASYTHQDAYNSDSFISVPLVHSNRLLGVLNLSNKRDGAPFNELDLDRAVLAGSVLAMTLSRQQAGEAGLASRLAA
jgi:hypothetical protein